MKAVGSASFLQAETVIDYSFFSCRSIRHVFQQVLVRGVVVKMTSILGPDVPSEGPWL